jgi:hypothetical protein
METNIMSTNETENTTNIKETSNDDTLTLFYTIAEQNYNFELDVKEKLETKATSLLGFSGIAITLHGPTLTSLFGDETYKSMNTVTFILLIISFILIIMSCFYSFLTIKLEKYTLLDINSYYSFDELRRSEKIIKGKMLNAYLKAISDNKKINALKVKYMHFAYVFFLLGFILFILSLLIILGLKI